MADGSLISLHSNLCLGTAGGSSANTTLTQIKTCAAAADQDWDISEAVIPLFPGFPDPHAPLPSGPFTTPTPTITVDYTQAPEFSTWMDSIVKPLLEDWYPVLGDYYAQSDHAPMSSFTVQIDSTYTGVAYVAGSQQKIVMGADYYRTHMNDVGSLIHEMGHIVSVNPATGNINMPSWLTEGFAEHARDFLYEDRVPWVLTASQTYLSGYRPTAALLDHAQTTSGGTFLKTLAANAWDNTYTDGLFVSASGHSLGDHWHQMTNQTTTDPGAVTNQSSAKCLDLPGSASGNGVLPQIWTCNSTNAQKWIFKAPSSTPLTGQVTGYLGGRCLSIVGNGTANGTAVEYRDCLVGSNPGQLWEVTTAIDTGGFTTLRNPNSGKCLQTIGGSSTSGTKLQIQPCTTATTQKWKFPAVYR